MPSSSQRSHCNRLKIMSRTVGYAYVVFTGDVAYTWDVADYGGWLRSVLIGQSFVTVSGEACETLNTLNHTFVNLWCVLEPDWFCRLHTRGRIRNEGCFIPKIPENFGRNSNGKVRFGFFRPEYSGSPLEVVHLFRSEYSDRNSPFYF